LARTHAPEQLGDSILGQQNIQDALAGKISTYYEEGTVVKVSVRTGAPVYDADGRLIGILSAGSRLDSNDVVDNLKERFQAEFTVTLDDTRIATTLFSQGERLIGSKIDPEIAQTVIEEKQDYFGNVEILGQRFGTHYIPLINAHNEVFAILVSGNPQEHLSQERNAFIFNGILIGLIGLAVSILMLWFITKKIVKPLNGLMSLVTAVTRGNIDINMDKSNVSQDEIGTLTLDLYLLVDVIKSMITDLTQLTQNMNMHRNTDFQIDTSTYSGSFKEIVDGIQSLGNSISMMHKTMAVMDYLDTKISVTDLNHNLLYINRSMAEAFGIDRERGNIINQKCYKIIRKYEEPCAICQMPNLLPQLSPEDIDSNPIIH
jgi:methyl-accepting chemotaxis protein